MRRLSLPPKGGCRCDAPAGVAGDELGESARETKADLKRRFRSVRDVRAGHDPRLDLDQKARVLGGKEASVADRHLLAAAAAGSG